MGCPKTYHTTKFVPIQSQCLAVTEIIILVIIVVYVVLFQIVLAKGYQITDQFSGSVDTKVKGIARSRGDTPLVWDSTDLVQPPGGYGAAFLTTNFILTRNQSRTTCLGTDTKGKPPATSKETCDFPHNLTCIPNRVTYHGVTTDRCVVDSHKEAMCVIRAWCPLEVDESVPENVLYDVADWTILVRVDGTFPHLAPDSRISTAGSDLIYNLNLFYVSDLIAAAEGGTLPDQSKSPSGRLSMKPFHSMAPKGAIIAMDLDFACDLDQALSKCTPDIRVTRLDNQGSFSYGYNFRYANKYTVGNGSTWDPSDERRDVYKVMGPLIVFTVHGVGGKFNFMALGITVGSGIGLLAIASVVTDFLLRCVLPFKELHTQQKYGDPGAAQRAHQEVEKLLAVQ